MTKEEINSEIVNWQKEDRNYRNAIADIFTDYALTGSRQPTEAEARTEKEHAYEIKSERIESESLPDWISPLPRKR